MTMAKTFDNLISAAENIRTNVLPESNTAGLVGQTLKDIVEKPREIGENEDLKNLKNLVADYIQKNSHTNAQTEDFLYVEDFSQSASIKNLTGTKRYTAVVKALNAWLDNISFVAGTDDKYIGRCKLGCDGVNVECYNYVCSWADNIGVQQIMGAASIGEDGKVNYGTGHNILFRLHENGEWGQWASYALKDIVSVPISNEEIDKLF